MAQFADDVAAGRKDFTIRPDRKRHARPGEQVQLYTGMRTKSCHKLVDPDPICEKVVPIVIYKTSEETCLIKLNGYILPSDQADYIVAIDGFKSYKEFIKFHLSCVDKVEKIFIKWGFWNAD